MPPVFFGDDVHTVIKRCHPSMACEHCDLEPPKQMYVCVLVS